LALLGSAAEPSRQGCGPKSAPTRTIRCPMVGKMPSSRRRECSDRSARGNRPGPTPPRRSLSGAGVRDDAL